MSNGKTFLGIGWSFPPSFDNRSGINKMVSDAEDIAQSLRLILLTAYGERIMRPEFGSNLFNTIFGSINSLTINKISRYINQSVLEFEPRVTLNNVEIDQDVVNDGKLNIKLDYTIRTINVRTNIVFPFYFKEGTNISDM